jgi:hypothetical protein
VKVLQDGIPEGSKITHNYVLAFYAWDCDSAGRLFKFTGVLLVGLHDRPERFLFGLFDEV